MNQVLNQVINRSSNLKQKKANIKILKINFETYMILFKYTIIQNVLSYTLV